MSDLAIDVLHELPPLEDTVKEHGIHIGDIIMFATVSSDERSSERLKPLVDVLGPYVSAGLLQVNEVPKVQLSVVN